MKEVNENPISQNEADYALSQWDDYFMDKERQIVYMAVIKSNSSEPNYEIEFGVNMDSKISSGDLTRAELLQLEIEIPALLPLEKVDLSTHDVTSHKSIKTRIVRATLAEFIAPSLSNDFTPDFNIQGGKSVSNEDFFLGGTLGAILELVDFEGFFGISNWHVIQDRNSVRDDIIYNPRIKGMTTQTQKDEAKAGILVWESLDNLDAAIYKFQDLDRLHTGLACGIKINGLSSPIIDSDVIKCGFKTGKRAGKIKSINATVHVDPRDEGDLIKFKNQIQIEGATFSDRGDSGSLVIDENNQAVGLVFAKEKLNINAFTYANNLNFIFNHKFNSKEYFLIDGKKIPLEEIKFKTFY